MVKTMNPGLSAFTFYTQYLKKRKNNSKCPLQLFFGPTGQFLFGKSKKLFIGEIK